ncbi:PIN domain-containing protein [Streptomyces subrutilus]|uniref:PIN domain-containing protein n=1 Tax=Streptomyces subrutilus TaxID=36818 RepID=UPI00114C89D4|nr:PIN domain-containing protein [Streptomyces subrutilus]
MIILDTNQLRRALPGNPTLTLLTEAARRCGHTLAITDIVLREAVRQHREGLAQARRALESAQRELNKHVRPASRIVSTAWAGRPSNLETEFFEASLRQAFNVLPTHPEDALEALEREADRRPPCKANGEGGRDTTIYLTALRAARRDNNLESVTAKIAGRSGEGHPLPVIFVTEDKGFTDPQDRSAFAPELRQEIGDAPLTLRLDIVSALADIGYPSGWVDAKTITERDDFLGMLRGAVTREALSLLSPAPHDVFPEWVRVRTPRARRKLGKARQCKGNGLTLSTVTGTWSSSIYARNRPDGLSPSSLKGDYRLRILADCTVLVVQDEHGEVLEADVSSIAVTITD